MWIKKITLCLCAGLLMLNGIAQKKYTFRSQNFIGIIRGQEENALLVQTINGIQRKSVFAGLGVGLDNYRIQSVPVFLNVSTFLFGDQNFFVTGSGGINFSTQKDRLGILLSSGVQYPARAYWEGGIGFRVPTGDRGGAILFNAGYSYKSIREKRKTSSPCPTGNCPEGHEMYDFRMSRFLFKVGYMF